MRTGFVMLAGWAYVALGTAPEGTLRVEIQDANTGRPVPAMVCITSLADDTPRTPPDGRQPSPYLTDRDYYDPPDYRGDGIGPVCLMNGPGRRGSIYRNGPAYPFWLEKIAYFVARPFSIDLAPGKWRLAVHRGFEYEPVYQEFEIAPRASVSRTIRMKRWVNMPRAGWYSGDGHVHHPRLRPNHDEMLLNFAQAEDVHVMNVLAFGDRERTYMEQAGFGKAYRRQRENYSLVSGQEDPRTLEIYGQGHTLALNIAGMVRDVSRYHLYDTVFDAVHAQGGLTGYAHMAWVRQFFGQRRPTMLHPTWDPNINVPRGRIDFFEILQFRHLGLEDYYDYLNLGIKLTALAGSDFPWSQTIGETRVYAHTGPGFSVDAWFDALKRGRTFVTNGPMLEFTVGEAMPGDELRRERGATVRVRARVWAPASIGSPTTLEIVSHGRVIHRAESRDPRKQELRLEVRMKARHSQWLAIRATSHNGAVAHSSPVYLLVNGQGFADPEQAPAIAAKRKAALEYIRCRLRETPAGYDTREIDALHARMREAEQFYNKW